MKLHNLYIRLLGLLLVLILVGGRGISAETNKKFTVVVDAGHGGKDIGANDNGVMEKNINLKVAKQLEALIKKKMKNVNVVMTREGDNYLTLQQRADKANKSQGDLFISIHTNSVDKRNKNRKNIAGSSVYTLGLHKDENNLGVAMRENSVIELEKDYQKKYSGFDPQRDESYIIFEMAQKKNLSQSIQLAENIQKELVNSGRQDRGVHQAGFWVLWATSMPSVLVELDFICNPESAKYISSDKGAKELAQAIFNAIEKYEASWSKNLKFSGNGDLSSVYTSETSSNLEESFTLTSTGEVAAARTRVHKNAGNVTGRSKKISDERRRRSKHSREVSNNQNYENNGIIFPGEKNYSVSSVEMSDNLAALSTGEKSYETNKKNLTKAEKKKLEKEEKKRAKEEEKLKKQQRNRDAHNAKINKLVTVYKIQILASKDLLNLNSSRFCGLTPISTYKENNLYKYYYGESTDKEEMESLLADVKKKIPDAFIVTSQKTVKK